MQGKILEDLSRSQTEFERFMENESRLQEIRFNQSRIGRWWDAFLQRRYARAVNRLRRLSKEEL